MSRNNYLIERDYYTINGVQEVMNLCEHLQDATLKNWVSYFDQFHWGAMHFDTLQDCVNALAANPYNAEAVNPTDIILIYDGEYYEAVIPVTLSTLDGAESYQGAHFLGRIRNASYCED